MVSIVTLWLPILVSAVLVFFISFALHTLLPLHRDDFRRLPAEDEVMDALRKFSIPPGDYMVPHAGGAEGMRSAAFKEKLAKGPVAMMTVYRNGPFDMNESLVQWFAFVLLVGAFAAYVAGRALGPGASYPAVFRFVGASAFMCHFMGQMQESIWHKRSWATTARFGVGSVVYALVTAGTFGWLWPK